MQEMLGLVGFDNVVGQLSLQDRWRLCTVSALSQHRVHTTLIRRITYLDEFQDIPASQLPTGYLKRICSTILQLDGCPSRFEDSHSYLPAHAQAFILPALSNVKSLGMLPGYALEMCMNVPAWSSLLSKVQSSLTMVEFRYELDMWGPFLSEIDANTQQFYFIGNIFPMMRRCGMQLWTQGDSGEDKAKIRQVLADLDKFLQNIGTMFPNLQILGSQMAIESDELKAHLSDYICGLSVPSLPGLGIQWLNGPSEWGWVEPSNAGAAAASGAGPAASGHVGFAASAF
jgi:hypothetical protein